jgi:hypothetical protein
MAKQIPLNEMLSALDRQDFDWYKNLPDEDKKSWSSWLTLRYASSVKGKGQDDALLNTNEFVNKHYLDLYKDDDLMWRLLCLTAIGKSQFHEWIKPPHSNKTKDKITEWIASIYPHMKSDELALFREMNDDKELKRLAVDMGMTDKEIDEIFGKTKGKKK